MAPPGTNKTILKKEDVLQALVIAENFDSPFRSLTDDCPTVLLPLVNNAVLDYTLEFLHAAGVQEVILFCCTYADKIKDFISNSRWVSCKTNMQIKITVSENCMSFGDVLRDVYDKRLITDNFVLLTGDIVSNMQLKPIVELHKERRSKDKYAVMTTIYKEATAGHAILSNDESNLIILNEETNRILHCQLLENKTKLSVPLNILLDNSNVRVCCDLLDCHISVCSPDVLSLFADNYDYQTRHDFLKGILEQEEILGNTIYLHVIKKEYAARVSNLQMYKAISHDIINRWAFPIVPDLFSRESKELYKHLQQNIYKHSDVTLARSCKLIKDVVVGHNAKIGEKTVISHSVIGSHCIIGDNVTLKNTFIWDNVEIHNGCQINMAILANGVVVKENATISNSILPYNFQVEAKCSIKNTFESNDNTTDADGSNDGDNEQDPWHAIVPSENYESSEFDSEETGNSDQDIPQVDDANLFHHEVFDTLHRGVEEKLKCDNLILEINSLKYAYNMTITEVNQVVTKSILELPTVLFPQVPASNSKEMLPHLKQLLLQFMDLIKNYIKNRDSQMDLLTTLKDHAFSHESFTGVLMNVLHFLYDKDVLQEDVIIAWYTQLVVSEPQERVIKEQITPLINWLNEAEEESD